jgi:hypothetical protein
MKASLMFIVLIIMVGMFSSCESEIDRNQRKVHEEQIHKERQEKTKREEAEKAIREVEKRKEKEIYDRYINNSLSTGSTPYAYCYGKKRNCSGYSCSELKVRTPHSSDVMVTIKNGDEVYQHAFITKNSSYTFELPNGIYQPFFYYGKGWNPNKVMKETECGTLKGGFIDNEIFGKDTPQSLYSAILEYELILQSNGNFSTKPSNANEAF